MTVVYSRDCICILGFGEISGFGILRSMVMRLCFCTVLGADRVWRRMSPAIAKVLRQYAIFLIPPIVLKRFPEMSTTLHRQIKSWWNNMPTKKRYGFLINAKNKGPLSEEYRALAYQSGILLDWPPKQIERGRDVKSKKAKRISSKFISKKPRVCKVVRSRVSKGAG